MYRAGHLVEDLGWVDFDLDCSTVLAAAMPILPDSRLPQQNRAESGQTPKIKVNSTQGRDQMPLPVRCVLFS